MSESNGKSVAETELWRGSYSSKSLAGAMILSLLLFATVSITTLVYTTTWGHAILVIGLAAMPELYCLAVVNYRRLTLKYILTNKRIVCESGLLTFASSRVALLVVDDVGYKQNDLDRVFGIGTITVVSRDKSDPTLLLRGVDNVGAVVQMIEDAAAAERTAHGTVVNTLG